MASNVTRRFLKATNDTEAVLGVASFKKDGKFQDWPVVKFGYSNWPLDEWDDLVAFINEERQKLSDDSPTK
jgi:hypothetical protein